MKKVVIGLLLVCLLLTLVGCMGNSGNLTEGFNK